MCFEHAFIESKDMPLSRQSSMAPGIICTGLTANVTGRECFSSWRQCAWLTATPVHRVWCPSVTHDGMSSPSSCYQLSHLQTPSQRHRVAHTRTSLPSPLAPQAFHGSALWLPCPAMCLSESARQAVSQYMPALQQTLQAAR